MSDIVPQGKEYKEETTTINRNQVFAKNSVHVWSDHFFFLSPKGNSQVTRVIAQKNCKKKYRSLEH